jgi:outer membrane protein TolC
MARQAQVEMEHARYFPDLGLTLNAGWSQAPEVTDQFNPFVRDPANYLRYGAALGLKWDLDFLPQSARAAEAEAKLEEMRATEQFALGGVGLEVEKAYYEAQGAAKRLELYAESAEWARRWMITVQQGIDIGVYEGEDLVKPAKEYALRRFSEISATFDYNMALGRLALATGWDEIAED